jgi:protein TonB
MAEDLKGIPNFDEIVFKSRNREYGAYVLRKKYNRNLLIALMIGVVIIVVSVIAPYLSAKANESRSKRTERQVEITLENLDQPTEKVAPPPELPPPADVTQQQKYVPPEVVDSIKPEEMQQLMTADEAQVEVTNKEVIEVVEQFREEVQETEARDPEPFIVVEEMPAFPGGEVALLKFIAANTKYPEIARDNNIEGKVIVRFCVTSKGGVDLVSVFKSVDPELDTEAIRVVKLLPTFKPGKQGGKPVPVWYSVPIAFQIIKE